MKMIVDRKPQYNAEYLKLFKLSYLSSVSAYY